jgi:hypothetical protein
MYAHCVFHFDISFDDIPELLDVSPEQSLIALYGIPEPPRDRQTLLRQVPKPNSYHRNPGVQQFNLRHGHVVHQSEDTVIFVSLYLIYFDLVDLPDVVSFDCLSGMC